ncbi:MAG: hypothetical protein E7168_00600 [Firmicutes bacterium]|nr:hypothetical protein [Bacillota bacterium]
MYKLNNRGWGFSTFIAFIAIFILAIILVVIGAINLGISSKEPISDSPVTTPIATPNTSGSNTSSNQEKILNYESQFKEISASHAREHYTNLANGEEIIFSLSNFIEGKHIGRLEVDGNSCTGYVVIKHLNGNYQATPYLRCGSLYTTSGYNSTFDK